MRKIAQVNILLWVALGITLIVAGYFFLPSILGDTVYPLKYENWIKQYSQKYGVDPALVCGVIMQESRWNPNAASGAGAQGLMQFMPGTAATMAKETGRWPSYNIFDPETSIDFGAAHLRDLLAKYNGNVDAALAGYNAGTGNVDAVFRSGNLMNLPSRGYINSVKKYRDVYASMYPEQIGLTATSATPEDKKVTVTKNEQDVRSSFWKTIFSRVTERSEAQK